MEKQQQKPELFSEVRSNSQNNTKTFNLALRACETGDTIFLTEVLSSPNLFTDIDNLHTIITEKGANSAFGGADLDGQRFGRLCRIAAKHNQPGALLLLLRYFHIKKINNEGLVFAAVDSGSADALEILWKVDAEIINWSWSHKGLLLPYAIMMNNTEHAIRIVQSLIKAGAAKPDRACYQLDTNPRAGLIAAQVGSLAVFKLCMTVDEDIPKNDFLGYAAQTGNLEIVQYLIEEHRLDIDEMCNVVDKVDGRVQQTALIAAASNGSRSVIQYLIDRNADPRKLDSMSRSALHIAGLRDDDYDIISELQKYEEIWINELVAKVNK